MYIYMTFLISSLVAFLVITLGAGAYGVKSKKKCGSTDKLKCQQQFCDLGITGRTSWRKWLLKNHPDKIKRAQPLLDEKEYDRIASLVHIVNSCVDTECWCPENGGGKRKRNKSRKRTRKNKNKTRKTRKVNKKSRKKSRK